MTKMGNGFWSSLCNKGGDNTLSCGSNKVLSNCCNTGNSSNTSQGLESQSFRGKQCTLYSFQWIGSEEAEQSTLHNELQWSSDMTVTMEKAFTNKLDAQSKLVIFAWNIRSKQPPVRIKDIDSLYKLNSCRDST